MSENAKEINRYKDAMENILDIVWEMDSNLNFTFVSPNAKELSGYEADEMVGRNLMEFLTDDSKHIVAAGMEMYRATRIAGSLKDPGWYEVEFVNRDGATRWYEVSVKPLFKEGSFTGYAGTSRDVSGKRAKEAEVKKYIEELESTNRKLDKLATFDMLTGVYNRRKFEQDVALAVEKKEKCESTFSIIMFDIDGFKKINDQYGHKMGDIILQEMAAVVKQALRETDKLFRWGGDEFVILLQETPQKGAFKVAEKVRETVDTYEFALEDGNITISLGVGEYLLGDSIDQFLSFVDNALLKAKANGKNRIEIRFGS